MMLTPGLLVAATGCTDERAQEFAGPIAEACQTYGITTPARLSMFLAQVGHESGSLRYVREIASGQAYEGRKDLGNTQPGDGQRYRGHGLLQTTGRANHVKVRDRLRARLGNWVPDFEAAPELLEVPQWAAMSAADYWDMRGINALADAGDIQAVTRAINGGLNGLPDRIQRLSRAQAALDTAAAPATNRAPAGPIPSAPSTSTPAGELAGDQEPTMAPLLVGLAASLIDIFTPLAKEKITKEIGRHTDSPEVATQISAAIIETAKAVTGQANPVAAVAAVQADTELLRRVEASAIDEVAKMAPLLDKLSQWDQQAWQAEEASRDAAARRVRDDEFDMTQVLLLGALIMIAALILLVAGIVIVQVIKSDSPDTATWSALTGLIGWATGVGGTIYSYRFGTTRNSSSKDAVIQQMQQRAK